MKENKSLSVQYFFQIRKRSEKLLQNKLHPANKKEK